NYPMPLSQTTSQPSNSVTPTNDLTQQQSQVQHSSRLDTKAFARPIMRDISTPSSPAQRRERILNPSIKQVRSLTTSNTIDQDQEPLYYVSRPPIKRNTTVTNYDQD
ncbi:unnamed protein product, partial [Didymodactylos carnosus]